MRASTCNICCRRLASSLSAVSYCWADHAGAEVCTPMTTLTRAVLTDDAMISCWICISSCVATCAVTSTRRFPLESFSAACIFQKFFFVGSWLRAVSSAFHCRLNPSDDRLELGQCVQVLLLCLLNCLSHRQRESPTSLPPLLFALRSAAGDHRPLMLHRVPDQIHTRDPRQVSA